MKRRRLLVGLASLAAGGIPLGTGAFTRIMGERNADVEVVTDGDAYLTMEPLGWSTPNGAFAREGAGGIILLDFDYLGGSTGSGVGTNSVYQFDRVFALENQSTQSVYVEASFGGGLASELDVWLYVADQANKPLDGISSVLELGVGDVAEIGVGIDTYGTSIDGHLGTMTIRADATTDASGLTVLNGLGA